MVVQTIDDARQIIIEIKDPLGITGLINGHLLEPPNQLSSTVQIGADQFGRGLNSPCVVLELAPVYRAGIDHRKKPARLVTQV